MKAYPQAKKIKVKFAGQVVTLANADDRQTTRAGVVIWIKKNPGGEIQPMATIPDGTLNQYMHNRPEIVNMQWE